MIHELGPVEYRNLRSVIGDPDMRQAYATCSCGVGVGQNYLLMDETDPHFSDMDSAAAHHLRRYFDSHVRDAA